VTKLVKKLDSLLSGCTHHFSARIHAPAYDRLVVVTREGRTLYRELLIDEELIALRAQFCRTVTKQLASVAA
jgi:hypothetical protein